MLAVDASLSVSVWVGAFNTITSEMEETLMPNCVDVARIMTGKSILAFSDNIALAQG